MIRNGEVEHYLKSVPCPQKYKLSFYERSDHYFPDPFCIYAGMSQDRILLLLAIENSGKH